MDELIVKVLAGEASDIDERTVARWREVSPQNDKVFRELRTVWESARDVESGLFVGSPPRAEDLLRAAEQRRQAKRARAGRRRILGSPWIGYGLAAAAVAALVFVGRRDPDVGRAPLLSPVESTSSADDVVTMALSDGSVLRLSESSSVEFPGAADRREVVLNGRAFFAVAEAETPFVVRTGLGEVTVTGTRFEVSTTADGLRVVVVEGTVSLAGAGSTVAVRAGQVGLLPRGGEPSVVDADVWSLLDWAGGLLVFQATPLSVVGPELGRHFGRAVRVVEELEARRVTAWFADEPVEEVVAAVCLVAGTACEVGQDSITIGR